MDYGQIEFIDTEKNRIKVETDEGNSLTKEDSGSNTKCGEVFTPNNVDFILICGFCTMTCTNLDAFGKHIREKHTNDPVSSFDQVRVDGESNEDSSSSKQSQTNCSTTCKSVYVEVNPQNSDIEIPINDSDNIAQREENSGEPKKKRHIPVKCEDCGRLYSSVSFIRSYHKCKAGKRHSNRKYNCLKCHRRFDTFKILQEHFCKANLFEEGECKTASSGTKEDEEKIDKTFTSDEEPSDTESDLKSKPENPLNPDFYCGICRHQFRIRSAFRKHAMDHDTPCEAIKRMPGFLRCQFCNVKFTEMVEWRDHEKTHTIEANPYACPYCSKCFQRPYLRQAHIDAHHLKLPQATAKFKLKPHACKLCEMKFARPSELKVHMLVHTGEKPFQCDICGRRYPKAHLLRYHKKTHTNTKDKICSHCGMAFYTSGSLGKHLTKHTDERPLSCNICGKAFKHRKTLACHKKIHAEKKQYKCAVCQKEFSQPTGLYLHKKTHAIVDLNRSCLGSREENL